MRSYSSTNRFYTEMENLRKRPLRLLPSRALMLSSIVTVAYGRALNLEGRAPLHKVSECRPSTQPGSSAWSTGPIPRHGSGKLSSF
ncbi:hypothetical protein FA13DRAFT_325224 [Coprinellus micaceus]|uniref:Uncharacterized protein n=1 Tax=Coprinellus micaceus TaxID=71717 RepID=A0A4Y7SDL5_COPMI|nr:hypothetical protein FA13DRAFT_325224 [Coprinellus micaceus]